MEQGVHVIESLPAYAIGCLSEDEAAVVAQHLETCAACRAALVEYQQVVDRLAFAAPDVEPPAALKRRILEQVSAEHGGAVQGGGGAQPAAPSGWGRLSGLFRTAPAWGVAALGLAILLVVSNVWWWQRAAERPPAGGMRAIAMHSTGAAPGGTGTLVISEDGEYGTLVVDGLPMLDEAHSYQLWLIRDGQRTSGGVFDVSDEGYGALVVSSPEPLSAYPAFGVTVEPAGGSSQPTGERVLEAGLH